MPTPFNQLLSRTLYITDGSTTEWDFSFSGGYILKSHIKAHIEAPSGARYDLVVTEDMITGPFTLRVAPALVAGNILTIYRDTPKDLPLVDFTDESGFSEVSLDTNAKQAVFIAAEGADILTLTNLQAAFTAAEAAGLSAEAAGLSAEAATASALAAAASRAAADLDAVATAADRMAVTANYNNAVAIYNGIVAVNAAVTSASSSATSAGDSATAASNSATAASGSATASANAATASSNSATAASGSATAADGSAVAAAASKAAAAGSASAASGSASAAAASYDAFDDRWLGSKAVAPTVDNDGDPLIVGSVYWDTVINGGTLRVWNGSWVTVPASNWATSGANTDITSIAGNAATATTAAAAPWSGVTGKPTTVAGYGITDMGSQSVNYANTSGNGGVTSVNGMTGPVTINSEPTTEAVGAALAGLTAYAVGSYVIGTATSSPVNTSLSANSTVSGSQLFTMGVSSSYNLVSSGAATAGVGTWRLMHSVNGATGARSGGLYLRIA